MFCPGDRSTMRPGETLRWVDAARLADEGLDLADLALAEAEVARANDPFDLPAVTPADDRAGDRQVSQRPSNRDLAGGSAMAGADPGERVGQREVARQP